MATDRALNKTAAASGYYGAVYEASKANDGNDGTRWADNATNPWWSVDLAADYAICGATIFWNTSNDAATDYDIQYSDNNTDWTTAKNVTGAGAGRVDSVNWTQATAHRYWRAYVNTKGSSGYASILTIELYDDGVDRATGKTVAASSVYGAGYEAAKANDGLSGTRWADNGSTSPGWWSVDLATDYAINAATIIWNDAARDYDVQYSDNNSDWTDAHNITGSGGARTDRTSWTQATSHRYWRIFANTKSTNGYMSAFTVLLYAPDSSPPPASTGILFATFI